MTSQEPENPHSAEPDNPDTEVIAVAAPAPVFVDSTGRRSRLLRRLAYAFGVLVMLYGGLISVSLAGGPVRSSAVLPLPGLEADKDDDVPPARPGPIPEPNADHSTKSLTAIDALPPRRTSPASRLESTHVPSKSASAKPTPSKTIKPSASTSHPVESTTTSPATTPPTTPPATTPTTGPTTPPIPPTGATGTGGTGTGGQGGGSSMGDVPDGAA